MTKIKILTMLLFGSLLLAGSRPEQRQGRQLGADSLFIRQLFDSALLSGQSYGNLRSLCKEIGHRLTGSPQAAQAVHWAKEVMEGIGYDTVYLQEIKAPHWERGEGNSVKALVTHAGHHWYEPLQFTALGGSVPTDGLLQAEVIELASFDELEERSAEIQGKIVFFNCPMDKRMIDPFKAYGACAAYRYWGASEAAAHGAVAVAVRSLTTLTDRHAHTGSMAYKDTALKIPAIAVSTGAADQLHLLHSKGHRIELEVQLNCRTREDMTTYNVIGEVRGTTYPDHYMIVGGHLDSWDLGEGAHDDGAGSVQSMEAIRLLLVNGYRPQHSLRTVLFMNEENGNRGGETYAARASVQKEAHLLAIETDRGGFSPRGFTMVADNDQIQAVKGSFFRLLEPYGLHVFEAGFGGVDINPLAHPEHRVMPQLMLMGLFPDPQRYFDYHHSEADVFEAVNQRELELGGASMAAMLYLMDSWWDGLFNAG